MTIKHIFDVVAFEGYCIELSYLTLPNSRHILRDPIVHMFKSQEFSTISFATKIILTNLRLRLRVSCGVTYIYVV